VDDARIIRQVLDGDRDAFSHLVRKYMNVVYAMLVRLTGNREEARDLAQECFIRAYRNLHRFDPARSFAAWLFQIARNACVDQWRKKKENMEPLPETDVAERRTPEQIVVENEEWEEMAGWLRALPPHYQAVLLLRYRHDFSYHEIAEILEISPHDVANRIHRARKKLREMRDRDQRRETRDEVLCR
jgi:RNA polymerase sigma-70 factor (ECF subfamily)